MSRPDPVTLTADAERDLVLEMGRLPDAVAAAYDKRMPHELADFAYGLAQAFSRFYSQCPILSDEEAAVRGSRLTLAKAAHDQLALVLDLLGIEVPERM